MKSTLYLMQLSNTMELASYLIKDASVQYLQPENCVTETLFLL